MKKHLIYTGMFLAAIGFSACNEDFKDWADPQSNPQEEAITAMVDITPVASMKLDRNFRSRQRCQHCNGCNHSRFRRNCEVKLNHS